MHTIRLKHPWECQPWGEGSLWSRKFNWPAGIVPGETAWLVIEAAGEISSPQLNETALAAAAPGRFEVTELLSHHNLLTVAHGAAPPESVRDCPLDVRLEILAGE